MFAAVTGLGLSASAGLNAYIPILVVGLLARFTDAVPLPDEFDWMTSGWAIALISVLLAAEVVLDKVAVVDHVNDMIQTAVRPAAGGAVFAATTAAEQVDASSFMRDNPWIGWVLGIAVAFVVHLAKTSIRPVVNAGTLGTGTPVVSAVEDTVSLGTSLLAILLPVVALVVLIAFAWLLYRLVRKVRARRRSKPPASTPHGGLS
jgi:peptidoglycan/LPS O-acetylase OafA/YrhL